jgi:hypothetical protein
MGRVHWSGSGTPLVPLALRIPAGDPTAITTVGSIVIEWPDGASDSTDVRLARRLSHLRQSPGAAIDSTAPPAGRAGDGSSSAVPAVGRSGLNGDLMLEITETNGVAPPGGVLSLKYVLYHADGTAGRIRLHVEAPPGWQVQGTAASEVERQLNAWEIAREELRIAIPMDAPVGLRGVVRLVAEMEEEPGSAEALTHVQVLSGGGLRSGGAHLAGTTTLNVSRIGPAAYEGSRVAGAVDMSGKLARQTHLSLSYRRGPRENRTNHRHDLDDEYLGGLLRHRGWNLEYGTRVSSSGDVLTGPAVNGHGVALRRLNGRVFTELIAARPTTFSGAGAGHLWRGRVGVRTSLGTIAVAASDFARPEGGYSTLPPVFEPTLDPDSLEARERELELSAASGSTRARGAGLDANLQWNGVHRLLLRGGALRLESAGGEEVTAPSLEAHYSFTRSFASLNMRWRQAPPTVQGIYIPGDELAADGSVRLLGDLRVVARGYRFSHESLGQSFGFGTSGTSLGLRYLQRRWRLEAHGLQREAHSSTRSLRRTGQLLFGAPLGPLSLSGNMEIGTDAGATGVHAYRYYRGDLRWSGGSGYASFNVGAVESGGSPPRLRADLLGSLMLGEWEVAGGAWATRGWPAGSEPGAWLQLGVPLLSEFTLLLGAEHAPRPHAPDTSPWRASLGLRKKLILPLPLLPGDGALGQPSSAAPPAPPR